MARKLYVCRDRYGVVLSATFDKPAHDAWKAANQYNKSGSRWVQSYKDLVYAMLQSGTSRDLFNAGWRMASESDEFSSNRPKLSELQDFIGAADSDADIVDASISELVNDPDSRFYLHG